MGGIPPILYHHKKVSSIGATSGYFNLLSGLTWLVSHSEMGERHMLPVIAFSLTHFLPEKKEIKSRFVPSGLSAEYVVNVALGSHRR